ncbi:MAG: PhzF family phenazine biosynthesis protein [Oscillospiraceae bacterium]|nr:PhzF family phenazine biosynthesis protein [Oscillospiraceae bacterium]
MRYYIVDSFTDKLFSGNPAGVCIADKPISDDIMQKMAFENNLSETAFVRKTEDGYNLRWFTPTFEIDLCGHATLAAAFVIFSFIEPDSHIVRFSTVSGVLTVERKGELLEMSFPVRKPKRIEVTEEISAALGFVPAELYSERDLYAVADSEKAVSDYAPDYQRLAELDKWLGIAITAKGNDCDFVSRFFCPELKLEDPVTGSSHSSLVPLWSDKLGKDEFTAKQLSKRGGTLYCRLCENEIRISGRAVLYLSGEVDL